MDDKCPTTQCIKVDSLRRDYNDKNIDLRKWMSDPSNLYVGRRGRIFINGEIFHYPESKWRNPFKVSKDCTLEKSLSKYREHVLGSELKDQLGELTGLKLGCFCDQSGGCHAKVLTELFVAAKRPLIPKVKIPEMKIPEMKIPEMKIPEMKIPEMKIPEVKQTPVVSSTDTEICRAIKKDGYRCTYKVKANGLCGVHKNYQ